MGRVTHQLLAQSLGLYEIAKRIAKFEAPAGFASLVDALTDWLPIEVAILVETEAQQPKSAWRSCDATDTAVQAADAQAHAVLSRLSVSDGIVEAERIRREVTLPIRIPAASPKASPASLTLPLYTDGRLLGVLHIECREPMGAIGVSFLGAVSDLLGLALDRQRSQRVARDAMRAREETLSLVSHDLRAPLNTIWLSAELLGSAPGSIKRYQGLIQRAVKRMGRIMDDLVDLAHIDAGTLSLQIRRDDSGAIIDEAIDMMCPLAEHDGISVARDPRSVCAAIECDRDRVLQIFSNLIGNAIKFGHRGSCILVSCGIDSEWAWFAVTDDGPGIPPDQVDHVFDRGWRAPENNAKGAGLGLYIVAAIVRAHGGRFSVESRLGQGTTFSFQLPLFQQPTMNCAAPA